MSKHDSLWNYLPHNEGSRLMPYMIERQILHIEQCKAKAVSAHKAHMKSLNDHIQNCYDDLEKYSKY